MKIRRLLSLAAGAGLWLGSVAMAQEPAKLPFASMSNQQVANSVAAALEQGNLRGYSIDVSVVNGAVELTGRVSNRTQHEQVIKTVLAVPGVKSVVDSLAVATIQPIQTVQNVVTTPAVENPPLPAPLGYPGAPIIDPIPVAQPYGAAAGDMNPPRLPPYAWPTYAPYNNYSRVAYPTQYPSNAFPFIGPFYPFPKVPLGWRSVTMEWQDGHWWYRRNGTQQDHWRVRFW